MHYVEYLFLYLASKTGRKILSLSMRKYGDSLDKFEPNDLNSAHVPSPDFFNKIPTEQVEAAVQQIESTGCVPDYIETAFEELLPELVH
jgi:adenine-specific DNA-methyltransferase